MPAMAARRFVFFAGIGEYRVPGAIERRELWLGIEIDGEVDLARFSREHGYDLIPADDLSSAELASIDVQRFIPFSS